MLKIDVKPIAFRLLNNRTAHSDYLRLTQEQAVTIMEVVKQVKSQNPLNNSLESACPSNCSLPDQHDDVPVVPEPVLVDEDEDLEEDEFEEKEDPQEEEDDMEVDIEEDENEPELTYPYKEMDPLNAPPPTFESEPEDAIEVENPTEHEDETIPTSIHEMASLSRRLCSRETAHALVEKKGKAKDEFYGKLILDLGNELRSSMDQRTAAIEKLVEKLGNAEDKVECKKLKKELEEARFSNTFLRMQNERVKRDLC
nr:hypothetical protein [Tanacetum cinerariifolium]